GGSTPSSSRSCPELPPLSNIVTTALSRSHGLCFKPPSRLGNPVPPPKQPTFSSRRRMGDLILVLGRWSLVVGRRSWVVGRGSWVVGRGSRVMVMERLMTNDE